MCVRAWCDCRGRPSAEAFAVAVLTLRDVLLVVARARTRAAPTRTAAVIAQTGGALCSISLTQGP